MKATKMNASLLTILLCVACGSTLPPKELSDARAAYKRVAASQAKELAPAQLDTGKQALDKAEQSFEEEGDDPITVDLAYVALRRIELADAEAGREAAERARGAADKGFKEGQLDALDKTKAELERERATGKAEVAKAKAELEAERKARQDAEKRAAAALASLNEIAKVKEEANKVVITLSGAVLFATGKYDLLPIARQKLDEVAKALLEQPFKTITVEGHTDSRGSLSKNQALSQDRAESVRSYLISRGLPSDKTKAAGHGSSRPVADNDSAEGRANNRRVEIVVDK
ncbi:MAG TPA: OmpA family protein [Polyangiaceae bacterium]|nr:OmpA family protein [Polyangiaceae bacterium]